MRVSIVQAVLNSHEIVRRQLLHYNKMEMPGDVELVLVDDGSDPPLDFSWFQPNFKFIPCATHDKRPWTQPAARNFGVRRANGRYLILTDIDHIIPKEVVEAARMCIWDVLRLKRELGILDKNGNFSQRFDDLIAYGITEDRLERKGVNLPPHGNSSIIKKNLYIDLGGVSEKMVGSGLHPNREERPLKSKLRKLANNGAIEIVDDDRRPTFYMFPNGRFCGDKDYNPFGLFHDLKRMTR